MSLPDFSTEFTPDIYDTTDKITNTEQGHDTAGLDQLIHSLETQTQDNAQASEELSENPDILTVRQLLSGKHVVMLGGTVLPHHHQAIEAAFDITLEWLPEARYASGLQAGVRVGPHTALVILAIRWMSHSHTSIREAAKAYGIPFVLHPAGLNPTSLAHHIVRQAGKRLGLPDVQAEA